MITSMFVVSSPSSATAINPGDLDDTFGTNGVVRSSINPSGFGGASVAVQPDGKIVVAGEVYNGSNVDFIVLRYHSDGRADNTFGGNGQVITDVSNGRSDGAKSVAIQSDGKIIAAGYANVGGSNNDFAIVRYNTNGTIDTTFSPDGIITTDIDNGISDQINDIEIQPDGKLIAVGHTTGKISVARYETNGDLDNTFDSDGKLLTAFGTETSGNSLALQTDGKIVVAGYTEISVSDDDFGVVRYNANGSLDTSFDSDGRATARLSSGYDRAYALVVQPDGKIVVSGYAHNGSNNDIAVARFNADGTLDSSFGSSGATTTPIGASNDVSFALALQSDAKIVAVGYARDATANANDMAILRYEADGDLDTAFGNNGVIVQEFDSDNSFADDVVIQRDGKIVMIGYAGQSIAVIRYHASTPVPITPTPEPPIQLVASPASVIYKAGNNRVTLSWTAATGAASYLVTRSNGTIVCTTSATRCTIKKMRNGTATTFTVYSINAIGTRSTPGITITTRAGIQVKNTAVKTKKKIRLTALASTPSKGMKRWTVLSGSCRIQGARLVTPNRNSICKLRLTVSKWRTYSEMSSTIRIKVSK